MSKYYKYDIIYIDRGFRRKQVTVLAIAIRATHLLRAVQKAFAHALYIGFSNAKRRVRRSRTM